MNAKVEDLFVFCLPIRIRIRVCVRVRVLLQTVSGTGGVVDVRRDGGTGGRRTEGRIADG